MRNGTELRPLIASDGTLHACQDVGLRTPCCLSVCFLQLAVAVDGVLRVVVIYLYKCMYSYLRRYSLCIVELCVSSLLRRRPGVGVSVEVE